jgi:hypothetical protein
VGLSGYSGFFHHKNCSPWYSWNIAESGVKKTKIKSTYMTVLYIFIWRYYMLLYTIHIYSYIPILYTLICLSYIHFDDVPIYPYITNK